jgi:glycosyltransferase involved in cell wall biosynthesis
MEERDRVKSKPAEAGRSRMGASSRLYLAAAHRLSWEAHEHRPDETIDSVQISIVVPVYNEAESLRPLYAQLDRVMQVLEQSCELIFIDDGSTDGSFAILEQLQNDDPRVYVIRLRRNFGQAAAFSAGFDWANGQVIVTLDADLQNDPADIHTLLAKLDEGYDVVSGWRVSRQDAFLTRRLPSQAANFLISVFTGVRLHDSGCSLKAYRSEVVKNLHLYGEMHRFLPSLASWMGVRIAEVPVKHAPRQFGRSKYGLKRAIMVFLDLITVKFLLDYSTRPIQIFGLVGILCETVGLVLGGYLVVLKLGYHQGIGDRPLLLLAVLLVVLGVQFITMGLLGELVIRNYHEVQGKPIYIVREILGPHQT